MIHSMLFQAELHCYHYEVKYHIEENKVFIEIPIFHHTLNFEVHFYFSDRLSMTKRIMRADHKGKFSNRISSGSFHYLHVDKVRGRVNTWDHFDMSQNKFLKCFSFSCGRVRKITWWAALLGETWFSILFTVQLWCHISNCSSIIVAISS